VKSGNYKLKKTGKGARLMTEVADEKAASAVTRKIPRPGIKDDRLLQFTKVLEEANKYSGKPFSIIVAQIDPDAIGGAFGMQELLRVLEFESTIYYAGKVAHPQNESLCNKYGLLSKMRPVSELFRDDVGKEDRCFAENVVLVDSNRAQDSRLPSSVTPVIVVDHHRNTDVKETDSSFVWLDEDGVGAASTMVAELLSELTPDDWEFRSDLAMMLALGIYTDTKGRTRAGARDDSAYAWCKRYANTSDLMHLILYKRPFTFLKNLSRGVQYVEKHDTYRQGRILAGLGRIPEKQGDDLAMVADELLRTMGAPLTGTWALIEGEDGACKIRFCARSEEPGINLTEHLQKRFGRNSGAKNLPDGTGEGGALFEFPTGPWLKDDEMEEIVNRRIIEWFFDKDDKSDE
jgi:nanoRNase/pAp phosphatase (c-di-AMP/oligoRNAs hydrolase)